MADAEAIQVLREGGETLVVQVVEVGDLTADDGIQREFYLPELPPGKHESSRGRAWEWFRMIRPPLKQGHNIKCLVPGCMNPYFKKTQASTGNLIRHIRAKHPQLLGELEKPGRIRKMKSGSPLSPLMVAGRSASVSGVSTGVSGDRAFVIGCCVLLEPFARGRDLLDRIPGLDQATYLPPGEDLCLEILGQLYAECVAATSLELESTLSYVGAGPYLGAAVTISQAPAGGSIATLVGSFVYATLEGGGALRKRKASDDGVSSAEGMLLSLRRRVLAVAVLPPGGENKEVAQWLGRLEELLPGGHGPPSQHLVGVVAGRGLEGALGVVGCPYLPCISEHLEDCGRLALAEAVDDVAPHAAVARHFFESSAAAEALDAIQVEAGRPRIGLCSPGSEGSLAATMDILVSTAAARHDVEEYSRRNPGDLPDLGNLAASLEWQGALGAAAAGSAHLRGDPFTSAAAAVARLDRMQRRCEAGQEGAAPGVVRACAALAGALAGGAGGLGTEDARRLSAVALALHPAHRSSPLVTPEVWAEVSRECSVLKAAAPEPGAAWEGVAPPEGPRRRGVRDPTRFDAYDPGWAGGQPAAPAVGLPVEDEVVRYMMYPLQGGGGGGEDDPLAWWGRAARHFPTLHRLAMRYLALPAAAAGEVGLGASVDALRRGMPAHRVAQMIVVRGNVDLFSQA